MGYKNIILLRKTNTCFSTVKHFVVYEKLYLSYFLSAICMYFMFETILLFVWRIKINIVSRCNKTVNILFVVNKKMTETIMMAACPWWRIFGIIMIGLFLKDISRTRTKRKLFGLLAQSQCSCMAVSQLGSADSGCRGSPSERRRG